MKKKVKCPFCGFEQILEFDMGYISQTDIYYCGEDDGGCGKQFAIQYRHRLVIENIFKLEEIPHNED